MSEVKIGGVTISSWRRQKGALWVGINDFYQALDLIESLQARLEKVVNLGNRAQDYMTHGNECHWPVGSCDCLLLEWFTAWRAHTRSGEG